MGLDPQYPLEYTGFVYIGKTPTGDSANQGGPHAGGIWWSNEGTPTGDRFGS
jgi:hypothetical protein